MSIKRVTIKIFRYRNFCAKDTFSELYRSICKDIYYYVFLLRKNETLHGLGCKARL